MSVPLTRETANGTVKRIVVTGMGIVSCFGMDTNEFYQSLLDGKSGVKKVTSFDVGTWPTQFAAYIDSDKFSTEGYVAPKLARRLDPFLLYALVSGKKALENAGLKIGSDAFQSIDKARAGVLCGSGMGGVNMYLDNVAKLVNRGYDKVSPFFIPYTITNMVCYQFRSSTTFFENYPIASQLLTDLIVSLRERPSHVSY